MNGPDRDVYQYEPRHWLTAASLTAVAAHVIEHRNQPRMTASELVMVRGLNIESEDDAAYLLYVLSHLQIVGPADDEGRHPILATTRNAKELLHRAKATAAVAGQRDSQERNGGQA